MEASVAVAPFTSLHCVLKFWSMLKIKGNCYSEVVTPGYVKLVNISDYLKSCKTFFS